MPFNMDNKKLFAVIAVVVIVAAGVGGALYLSNQGDKSSNGRSTDMTGRLMVFGNANNDDYIDSEDVSMLEKIIAGTEQAADHKYADANQDGKISQSDIDMVQKMIKHEAMTIYYVDGNGATKSVEYPLERVVVVGTNVMLVVKAIGGVASGKVVGVTGEPKKDMTLFSDTANIAKVSTSVIVANIEDVTTIGNVDAIITMNSLVYVKNESAFTGAGISVVRMASSDNSQNVSTALTLGYLLQLEERAHKYAAFCDKVLQHITTTVKNLTDDQKKTCLCITMTNSVSGTTSDYYAMTLLAGGKNLADWAKVTQNYTAGDEWLLAEKYQSNYLLHYSQWSYATNTDYKAIYENLGTNFKDLKAYQDGNYVMINGNMPDIIRLAYTAAIFYPDLFGADYGNTVHQEYIDSFVDNLHDSGYQVTAAKFVITANMFS